MEECVQNIVLALPTAIEMGKKGYNIAKEIKDGKEIFDTIRGVMFKNNFEKIIEHLHSKNINDISFAKEKTQRLVNNNPERIRKFILIIEQQNSEEKIPYFSNLMDLVSKDQITIEQFDLYIEMLNDLYATDLTYFVEYMTKWITNKENARKVIESIKIDDVLSGKSNVIGYGYSDKKELDKFRRLTRTGLISEKSNSGLSQDGSISYNINKSTLHFYSAIIGNMELYDNYKNEFK